MIEKYQHSKNIFVHNVLKWSDTLKILQQVVQDFQSVFDHLGTLCIEGLRLQAAEIIYIQFTKIEISLSKS